MWPGLAAGEVEIAETTFDVCVIGHVARDINTIGGAELEPRPGGAAYYASMVYACLGLRIAVLTRLAAGDEPTLLPELYAAGVTVLNRGARQTTTFRNIYPADQPDARIQRVDSRADSLTVADLPPMRARIWQIGPLTEHDIDPAIIAHCGEAGGAVAMDVQGFTRRIVAGEVRASDPLAGAGHLRHVDVLKADEEEILAYTGCQTIDQAITRVRDAGVGEVLVTRGGQGSILIADGGQRRIGAVPPRRVVDTTGCGDTFLAAYMVHRLTGAGPATCARFASTVASLKIESFGAFHGRMEHIAARGASLRGSRHQPT